MRLELRDQRKIKGTTKPLMAILDLTPVPDPNQPQHGSSVLYMGTGSDIVSCYEVLLIFSFQATSYNH